MEDQKSRIYIEVYSILNLLGEDYINSLPKSLYEMIKKNTINTENLKYKSLYEINKNNVLKNSIAMIALFDLNYWRTSEKDKKELKLLLQENYVNNENEKRKKYNPDIIFNKNSNNKENIREVDITGKGEQKSQYDSSLPIMVKKENIFRKVINFFLKFFKRK